ncbi:hypothetical protein GO755_29815 [Spirosoma sp. HMF4905]|uniref:Uncharacterized protein n=1 Tax=Spirosoma arboris TaxID=2682092 RepID=A0A7K1SKG2_9BACT|nr:hypothetical protein [Spirosoma arboris]MVM34265.1 hypothetical protein [Spirosoma arboris]
MNTCNTCRALLVGLILGSLVIVLLFGPRTIQFFRTDAGFRAWLTARWKWARRHGPTWKELIIMVIIWVIGFLAYRLINHSY